MSLKRTSRVVLLVLATLAIAGVAGFAVFVRRNVTVERSEPDEAMQRFVAARGVFAGSEPVLRVDPAGKVHRSLPPDRQATRPTHLYVLAYRRPQKRLVRAAVPFWFLKVKGPAMQYSLRDTGLDLQRLGVTPADLERYGRCLVLDESRSNGDRLLVWTE